MSVLKYYHMFKTTCLVDGSAFFGIRQNEDPMWDEHIDYIGTGPKLRAKIMQCGGPQSVKTHFKTEVLFTSTSRELVEQHINGILTPATYADPLCLNVSPQEAAKNIAEAHTGLKQAELTKQTIAVSMMRNENALGHVVTDEVKEELSEIRINKKLKWIHDPTTRQEMQIAAEELEETKLDDGSAISGMPTGFQLGRLPKHLKDLGPVPADESKKYVDY